MAEGVLTDFFTENRAEVVDLFLTEWDEEKYRDLLRREAEEDGYAAGEAEGRKEGLKQGLEQGLAQGLEQGLEQGLAQGLEEGRREGHEEGLNEGRKAVRDEYLRKAVSQVRSGRLTPEDAAVIFEFSQEEILALLDF
jgi:flagellar biosynthesis/type III secretory pathway protein FliH